MKWTSLKIAVPFYLQSRRHLGFALRSEGRFLGSLLGFAKSLNHHSPLTIDLISRWIASSARSAFQRARQWQAARRLAIFLAAFDPRTQIPASGVYGKTSCRRPVHIYTSGEVEVLLEGCDQIDRAGANHVGTFKNLIALLSCTGLRISEALSLQFQDWDPVEKTLTIRRSKTGPSRRLPLHRTAAQALSAYLKDRLALKSTHSALFLNERLEPLSYGRVNRTFACLRQRLGWKDKEPRPRLHDLRHTFAVNCLLNWYRNGEQELNAKIFSLAIYMGHRDIQATYWYLTGVPELLALATARRSKALKKRICP
jgi:integrase